MVARLLVGAGAGSLVEEAARLLVGTAAMLLVGVSTGLTVLAATVTLKDSLTSGELVGTTSEVAADTMVESSLIEAVTDATISVDTGKPPFEIVVLVNEV